MSNITVKEHLVEKRNILNEMRAVGWSLQELKFFDLYLSKINSRDLSSRKFKMLLRDFIINMDIIRPDIRNIRPVRDSLLQKIVIIPIKNEEGDIIGESTFQLFKECDIKIENDEWCIEFDAHDKALPLMFEFKEKYVTYEVKNILGLKGENHVRMYQILKQYEGLGEVTLSLAELRKRLGIEPTQYKIWSAFKYWVLEVCKKSLESTDIKYTYESIKRGSGKTSPVKAVKFLITKSDKAEQLTLFDKETVNQNNLSIPKQPYQLYKDPDTIAFASAFEFRFDEDEMKIIVQRLNNNPNAPKGIEKRINFFKRVNNELNYRKLKKSKENKPIKDDFAYTLGIIKSQLNEYGDKS
ncbi:MAG: replication initiation protein [Oscillospiraceae bacterium]|jgi:plasmid replication initiation protein|nr:replication initiation protein [Oscillospiraceae bacterium]